LAELLQRPIFGSVTGDLEISFACDGDFDFATLFEVKCINDG
jgi:hypothetical protein